MSHLFHFLFAILYLYKSIFSAKIIVFKNSEFSHWLLSCYSWHCLFQLFTLWIILCMARRGKVDLFPKSWMYLLTLWSLSHASGRFHCYLMQHRAHELYSCVYNCSALNVPLTNKQKCRGDAYFCLVLNLIWCRLLNDARLCLMWAKTKENVSFTQKWLAEVTRSDLMYQYISEHFSVYLYVNMMLADLSYKYIQSYSVSFTWCL